MRVAVAIPACHTDQPLLYRCLRSIARQTQPPVLVAVSISGVTVSISGVPVDVRLRQYPEYPFQLRVSYTTDMQNAAENRNRARAMIDQSELEVDIVCFFDCDDEMIPCRLEYISRVFASTQCDFVLTNLQTIRHYLPLVSLLPSTTIPELQYDHGVLRVMDDDPHFNIVLIPSDRVPQPHDTSMVFGIPCGHISIRNSTVHELFCTGSVGWEDIEYCGRLLRNGSKSGCYIYTPLAIYHKYNETWRDYYEMARNSHYPPETRALINAGLRVATTVQQKLLLLSVSKKLAAL